MATLVRRVGVSELRLHRTVTGRLRRCPMEPTRDLSSRVERRAVTIPGRGYLVPVHTRTTVPRGRSAAGLGAVAGVAQISVRLA